MVSGRTIAIAIVAIAALYASGFDPVGQAITFVSDLIVDLVADQLKPSLSIGSTLA